MKKNNFYIIIFLISFSFVGCFLRTYHPSIYLSSSSPMIFESADSSNKFSKYLSGDVTIGSGKYESELVRLIRGSYSLVNTGDHFNFNPRIFGYGGSYKVSGLDKYDGNKSVFGLGAEIGGSLNLKLRSLKIGLGANLGVLGEFGEYYNFRTQAEEEEKISKNSQLINYVISAFPVIAYEFSENTILSTQINIGISHGFSPSIVLNKDKYVYWFSWSLEGLGDRFVLGFMINLDKF